MTSPPFPPTLGLAGLLMLAPVAVVLSWAMILILASGCLLIIAAAVYFAATGETLSAWGLAAVGLAALGAAVALRRGLSAVFNRLANPLRIALPLSRIRGRDAGLFGSKASALAELGRRGTNIPRGYAVSGRLYRIAARRARGRTGKIEVPARHLKRLVRLHRRLLREGPAMVRSSFGIEDLSTGTAAGVFTSVRIKNTAALSKAISTVWASATSARAASLVKSIKPVNPAVLVHRLMGGAWIGRLLTSDPASGAAGIVHVEACEGDIFEPSKARCCAVSPAGPTEAGCGGPGAHVLSNLVEIGLDQSRRAGGAVEMEWCVDGATDPGLLTILQSRPAPRAREGGLWINSGAVELLAEPASPLGRDLIQSNFSIEHHLKLPQRLMGWGREAVEPRVEWFDGIPYVEADFVAQILRLSHERSRRLVPGLASLGRLRRLARSWPSRLVEYDATIEQATTAMRSINAADPRLKYAILSLSRVVYGEGMRLHAEGALLADQMRSGFLEIAGDWGIDTEDILDRAIADLPDDRSAKLRRARLELDRTLSTPGIAEMARESLLLRHRAEFGHRAAADVEISVPRPSTDPHVPIPRLSQPRDSVSIDEAWKELAVKAAHLKRGHLIPWEMIMLKGLLRRAVAAWPCRENAKDSLLRGMAELRRALLGYGALLAERGWIESADDVFMLQLMELFRTWDGAAPDRAELSRRRAELESWRRMPAAPAIVQGPDGVMHRREGNIGTPVSPGIAIGASARPGEAGPDDVLVMASPDVVNAGDLNVAAIVCQTGSALCHLGQLARERGIPMVVAVPGSMDWPAGTKIEVNGWAGTAAPVARDGAWT